MNKPIGRLALALVACSLAPAVEAGTIFSEAFSGSTVGAASPAAPTASSTDYAVLSSKNATGSSISSSLFLDMAATSSGFAEMQALFTTSPVTLGAGDSINLQMVFKPTNVLATDQTLNVGLYNSGGSGPVTGNQMANSGMGSGTTFNSGFAEDWAGYVGRVGLTSNQSIYTRDPQDAATDGTNEVQDVLFTNAGTGAYDEPSGITLATGSQVLSAFTNGNTYTLSLTISFDGTDVMIAQDIYAGAGTGGTNLYSLSGSQTGGYTTFDALAFGYRGTGNLDPNFEITSLVVSTGTVPEPSALALVGAGALSLLRRRRR